MLDRVEIYHETKIDIPLDERKQLIKLLNDRLADAIDLTYQLKQAHWAVKGPNFIGLHELFDKIYDDAGDYADDLAERAVSLGGTPEGTVHVASERSTLDPYPLDIVNGRDHVDAVASALAKFGAQIRQAIKQCEDIGDRDSADLFTEISRGVDKHLWFVEAHLQADS